MAIEIAGKANGAVYQEAAKAAKPVKTEAKQVTQNTSADTSMPATQVVAAAVQTESSSTNQQQQDPRSNAERIRSAVDRANTKIKNTRTRCEFSYHEETKRISIKILDKETNEVIREVPPEETLEMVEKMWELAGMVVDEKR